MIIGYGLLGPRAAWSAAHVRAPTTPSAGRFWARWKVMTADWVSGPKTPSRARRARPGACASQLFSNCWPNRTHGPRDPRRSAGLGPRIRPGPGAGSGGAASRGRTAGAHHAAPSWGWLMYLLTSAGSAVRCTSVTPERHERSTSCQISATAIPASCRATGW